MLYGSRMKASPWQILQTSLKTDQVDERSGLKFSNVCSFYIFYIYIYMSRADDVGYLGLVTDAIALVGPLCGVCVCVPVLVFWVYIEGGANSVIDLFPFASMVLNDTKVAVGDGAEGRNGAEVIAFDAGGRRALAEGGGVVLGKKSFLGAIEPSATSHSS